MKTHFNNEGVQGAIMKRFIVAVLATTAFGLAGCQDGPNQTYKVPPPNAQFNDGRANGTSPDGTAGTGTAPFTTAGNGGSNANEICTPQQIVQKNVVLNGAQIYLPNQVATLNVAGDDGTCATSP